ncbi:HELICc domain containing protein [uncultured Caudovirales phage]|uniref:HELICc domain containing protein n=1 Tax=uncultured Caudovirales phage TaxID=2100421 RepID=A0A6J5R8T9_9CAUD|nr:HELICc domain containing protein [uncultured Caudovirales phage]
MYVNHETSLEEYSFKTQPYEHQREALRRGAYREAYGYLMEMGTGKSKTLLDNIGVLYLSGLVDFAILFAPKGVYRNWVSKEIPEHFSDSVPHRTIRWVSSPNATQLKEIRSVATPFEGVTFFVMNIEALSTIKGVEALTWLGKKFGAKGMIGVDESTTIKNMKAKRTKNLIKAGAYFAYRRILTGSPVTKAPLDIYAQAEFLGPRLLGHSSYFAFQSRYAITQKRKMGAHSFEQVVGYRNLDELSGIISQFSYRVLKKDCLDLPEKVYTTREVDLTPEQAKMYDEIRHEGLTFLANGELVSTPSIISQMLRLQQVMSGHLKTDEGEIVEFPTNRLEELVSICSEASGKAIIWSRFRHDIQQITKRLNEEFGEGAAASYYGDTSDDERLRIVQDFQKPDNPLRFFIGNAATAGYGITLTEATTVVYYANSFDLEHRIQSEDRAHRLGQKNKVLYIDLISPNTIDEKIVKALRQKIDLGAKVLGEEAREWLRLSPKRTK